MKRNIEIEIIELLLSKKEGFRPTEIQKACKLTKPTLYKHLKKLDKKQIIRKEEIKSVRKQVFYKIDGFIAVMEAMFAVYEAAGQKKHFYSSKYCQENITPELLRYIENGWHIDEEEEEKYPSKAVVEQKREEWKKSKAAQNPSQTVGVQPAAEPEWDNPRLFDFDNRISYSLNDKNKTGTLNEPYPRYGTPEFFTEEDVLKILKLSPTALKKSMDRGHKEGMGKLHFQQMLLHSLILDLNTEQYINYKFVTELKIQFNEIGKTDQKFEKHCKIYTRDELGKTT